MISPAITADWTVQQSGHCPDSRPAGPPTPAAEQRTRKDVQDRLTHRFPDLPFEALASAAAEAFAFFADARVRQYIPVLALKRASGLLSERFATLDETQEADPASLDEHHRDSETGCKAEPSRFVADEPAGLKPSGR